jgi:hypothetical protein
VENVLSLGRSDDRRFFNQAASYYGPPAYIRRATRVEAAYQELLHRYRAKRDEWLAMPRIYLGALHMLTSDWPALRPLLRDDQQVEVLRSLMTALDPRPRLTIHPTRFLGKLRRALRELVASLHEFNRRWGEYLAEVDLTAHNQLRADYNRYYVLEKECAVRSSRLARQGFFPLVPLTVAHLEAALPLLPVPNIF